MRDQKFNHENKQKTHSNEGAKWRHARNSVEIALLKWWWRHIVVAKVLMGLENERIGRRSIDLGHAWAGLGDQSAR